MSVAGKGLRTADAADAADLDEVPGYRELTPLHRTGFATTYRARREDGGQPVALKILGSGFADLPLRKALHRELDAAQRLADQPHLLHVLDSGSTYAGRPYLVTRLCELGSLGDRLAGGPLPIEDVLADAVPVASTLDAIHRLGLRHRGVKPSNILLTADRQPMLADLVTSGLRAARLVTANGSTPLYTAPEVLRGEPPTPRTDVYSLAAALFHLLAGRPPYPGRGGVAALLLSTMTEPRPEIGRADVPDALRAALSRGLAVDPAERFPDAQTFAGALRQVLDELDTGTTQIETPPPATPPPTDGPPLDVPPPPGPTPHAAPPSVAPDLTPTVPPPDRPAPPADGTVENEPAPDDAPPPISFDPVTGTATFDLDGRPRRARPGVLAAALLGAVALATAGAVTVARSRGAAPEAEHRSPPSVGTPAASAPAATTPAGGTQPAGTPAATGAAPTGLTALDGGTVVSLHWTLPPGASGGNLAVQQVPLTPGQPPLTVLNPGTTSYPVTGLNPATGYCFLVGVIRSVGGPGQAGLVAWSAPLCIRGAHPAG